MVPEDTRPLGILTLEDVLEELINEEIVDETDRFLSWWPSGTLDPFVFLGSGFP